MTDETAKPPLSTNDAVLDVSAARLGLVIDPAWRPGVIANLEALDQISRLIMEFPLDDHVEPAAVFIPW